MRRQHALAILAGASLLITGVGAARTGRAHPAAGLSGTLTVFDWGSLGFANGKRAIAAYEKMHPGVKIQTIAQPTNPAPYIRQVLAAGTAPDILMPSYTQEVFDTIPQGYYLDLTAYTQKPDPYVAGNKHWADFIDPVDLKANSFLGTKTYVFSWTKQDATFFYNMDAYRKAGIGHPPATWSEFLAGQALLKKAGYIPTFFPLGEPFPVAENGTFLSLMESEVMNATFRKMDTNHDNTIDIRELLTAIKHHIYSPMNADYQEAWKLMKNWSQYWESSPAGAKNPPNTLAQSWVQGQAATYYAGQWALGLIPGAKLSFKWGTFHMPWVTRANSSFAASSPPGYGVWGAWNCDSWGIPAATQKRGHLALALDFLYWITAPKNAVPLALENGFTPVIKGYTPTDPVQKVFADTLQHPVLQDAAEFTLGSQFLSDRIAAMQGYIIGVYSLQQTMQQMQRAIDRAATQASRDTGISVN